MRLEPDMSGMRPSREEEYQRFMGFPAYVLPQLKTGNWWPHGARRHPIAWTRWRIAVRRRGPYAPDFDEFLGRRQPDR